MTETITSAAGIGSRDFWRAVGLRAIGAAVVAARDDNGPQGFLGLSTAHVSDDPPLMSVSVGKTTSALAPILGAGCFTLNFLTDAQEDLAKVFGGGGELKGAQRFTSATWDAMATGAPALVGAAGVIDCQVEQAIDLQSSMLVIGRVLAFRSEAGARPLVCYRGGYLK